MKIIKRIYDKLCLDKVGLPELLMAMYPILSAYQYGPIPFSLFIVLLIIFIYFRRNNRSFLLRDRSFKLLAIYVIAHDILLIILSGFSIQGFFINSLIAIIISLSAIFFITPCINWEKFVGSINWVTIICIIGMVYQFLQVQNGEPVGQLKIPFLPSSGLERLDDLYARPHSFFEEPAMYSQYMLIPLFIALLRKQYIWSSIIALSVFMSSSTTGLVLVFVELLFSVFIGKSSIWSKAFLFIIGGALIWTLMNTEIFSMATDKLTSESGIPEENIRLVQGPAIVSTMKGSDFIFGVPYANAYVYCMERNIPTALFEVYGKGSDATVYMTTLWQLILRFGLVGTVLYLLCYIRLIKNRLLLPILISFLIMTVTASFWFGPSFVFYSIFILGFNRYSK